MMDEEEESLKEHPSLKPFRTSEAEYGFWHFSTIHKTQIDKEVIIKEIRKTCIAEWENCGKALLENLGLNKEDGD